MKKLIFILYIVLVMVSHLHAQWFHLNQLPPNNNLREIKFSDPNTGYIVGYTGIILKTTNAGNSWFELFSGIPEGMESVYFTDNNTGYAVGNNPISGGSSRILKTTNGGTNWINQESSTTYEINSVFFIDANNGFAAVGQSSAGAQILRTNNGGFSWLVTGFPSSYWLESVFFTSVNNGCAVGHNGTMLRTTNGGTNWAYQVVGATSTYRSVFFANANIGYAVGNSQTGSFNGLIKKTTDAGVNWVDQPIGSLYGLHSVYFVDPNIGYAIGAHGQILKTIDGGANWVLRTSGTTENLNSVCFTDVLTGYVCGENGIVLKTTDGGTIWTIHNNGISDNFNSEYFIDATTGWIVENAGVILKTTNCGYNWASQPSGTSVDLNAIYFSDENNGHAFGYGGTYIKTTNGGNDWTAGYSGTSQTIKSVYAIDKNTFYIVGNNGIIRKTTNGGVNWIGQTSGITENLFSVYFVDYSIGYAVGGPIAYGMIVKTTNGGNNWYVPSSSIGSGLRSVYFTDANNGVAVGGMDLSGSYTIKTTNGGANWLNVTCGTSNNNFSVLFTDANTGYIVAMNDNIGTNQPIVKTTNAGSSWSPELCVSRNDLTCVYFPDPNTGYAIGSNGTILKYTSGLPGRPGKPAGPDSLCMNSPNSVFTTNGVCYADSYVWVISPAGAGIITGTGLTGTVDWNNTYSGSAQITVKGINGMGNGTVSHPCDVVISPATVAGSINGGSTICNGDSTSMLILTGYVGSIIKWQKRVNAGTWIDISNTLPTFKDIPSSPGTWEYRAEIQSGACTSLFSSPATVVVLPLTVAGIVSGGGSVCLGNSTGTLTLSGYTGVIIKWQKRFNSGSWVDITNTLPTYSEIPSSAGTWDYRAEVQLAGSCASFSIATSVNVSPLTVAGTVSGGSSICIGNYTGTLTLSGYAGTINKWQKRLNSGSWIDISNTAPTYSEMPSSSGVWDYRAEVQSGACPLQYSSYTTVNVSLQTVSGSVTGGNPICLGAPTGTLTLSGYIGTINKWQKRVNSGSWIDIANTLPTYSETPSSTGTWDYRAEVQSGVCPLLYSTETSVVVSPQTIAGIVNGDTIICMGQSTGTLTLSGHTGTINKWQKRFNAGSWTDISNTLTTYSEIPSSPGTWEYRAEVQSGACAVLFSSAATVIVNSSPPTPSIVQQGDSLISSASQNNQWYNSLGLIPGAVYQVYHPTESENYYVIVKENNCSSQPSNIIIFSMEGINNIVIFNNIKIYPNPVENELIIEIYGNTEKIDFEILNSIGQPVFRGTVIDKTIIKTDGFSPGLYLIKFENGKILEFKKIVKK